ncbi:hypothetical protein J8I87_14620 [Paraburkholderia sp. LEh10]|uniref:hypothetical protein n=1 Tax=Paraburkholderia sp. LEh10 TaxID=2821353 RepID=UPI001AE2794B|nr:hypothetical protein [Paraburkholderia sp. LEh10]MBP0590923.1 hypothetical protein [Paraburkholderia sp. LEh10]
MKYAISLLLTVLATVSVSAPAFAQGNIGVYRGLGVPGPVPSHPPSVTYQPAYSAPGTNGTPGTYVSPSAVYQGPPAVYWGPPPGYRQGRRHGNGWQNDW